MCAQFILTRGATAIPPLFLLALVWIGQPWWIHSNHCSLSTEAHRCWLCKRLCHAGSHTGSGINMVSWFKGQAEQEINMTLEQSSIQIYWVDGYGVSAFVCLSLCVFLYPSPKKRSEPRTTTTKPLSQFVAHISSPRKAERIHCLVSS